MPGQVRPTGSLLAPCGRPSATSTRAARRARSQLYAGPRVYLLKAPFGLSLFDSINCGASASETAVVQSGDAKPSRSRTRGEPGASGGVDWFRR